MNNIIELKSAEFIFVSGGKDKKKLERLPQPTSDKTESSFILSLPSVSTMIICFTVFLIDHYLKKKVSLLNNICINQFVRTNYIIKPKPDNKPGFLIMACSKIP